MESLAETLSSYHESSPKLLESAVNYNSTQGVVRSTRGSERSPLVLLRALGLRTGLLVTVSFVGALYFKTNGT